MATTAAINDNNWHTFYGERKFTSNLPLLVISRDFL